MLPGRGALDMASHSERPTLDLAAGRSALAHQMARVLSFKEKTLHELGWRQPSDRTLLIPMSGNSNGATDTYLLRLDFVSGGDWPPRAKFVNPETLAYVINTDQHHLPKISSDQVNVHPAYQSPDGRTLQLICCSAVFEYYDVSHGGEDNILWRGTDTFLNTLNAIERAFKTHYTGRFERHAG